MECVVIAFNNVVFDQFIQDFTIFLFNTRLIINIFIHSCQLCKCILSLFNSYVRIPYCNLLFDNDGAVT